MIRLAGTPLSLAMWAKSRAASAAATALAEPAGAMMFNTGAADLS